MFFAAGCETSTYRGKVEGKEKRVRKKRANK